MYIGKIGNDSVEIGAGSPNSSILITGMSGSGKTCRLNQIEFEAAMNGDTVLVLDMNQTHEEGQIFGPLRERYKHLENRIRIFEEGMELRFLQPMQNESFVNLVNSAINSLAAATRLGTRQIRALRTAVIYAIQNAVKFENEMTAITAGLLQQSSRDADAVYEKLWTLLNYGVFRASSKRIEVGKINILSFQNIDAISQTVLAEIVMSYLWRSAQCYGQTMNRKFVVVLDEFQNLALCKNSSLWNMLREGRKFQLSFLLATQSLDYFTKDKICILNQVGARLYFMPSINERRSIARAIDEEGMEVWLKRLSMLKIGESIAVGSFSIGKNVVDHPIIVR
ncbi:MAG: ATP-binding protein [Clostridiales bacterium]|nr:ATP-binding protein [Clostridiales bacterium]